jgi:hypothetical protein
MLHPKDPLSHEPNLDKMIVNLCIEKHVKNIMRMGMHKIVGQMQKNNLKH